MTEPAVESQQILLTGATGYVGSRLLPRLLGRAARVRCLTRRAERLAGTLPVGAKAFEGDALKIETLRPALEGVETAFYLIHSLEMDPSGLPSVFEEQALRAAENFLSVSEATGVKRIIALGALADETAAAVSPVFAERVKVGRLLISSSKVKTTLLRAPLVLGAGSAGFKFLNLLSGKSRVIPPPARLESLTQPIAVEDLLRRLLDCLENSETAGRVFDIGGATILSLKEMTDRLNALEGRRRRVFSGPLFQRMGGLLPRDLSLSPSIWRFLLEIFREDVLCRTDEIQDLIPLERASFDDAVQSALFEKKQKDSRRVPVVFSREESRRLLERDEDRLGEEAEISSFSALWINASIERVFSVLEGIGGPRGWFGAASWWRRVSWADRLRGGTGMSGGRTDPHRLRPGDPVDGWRVESLARPEALDLASMMRSLPETWLLFRLKRAPEGGTILLAGSSGNRVKPAILSRMLLGLRDRSEC